MILFESFSDTSTKQLSWSQKCFSLAKSFAQMVSALPEQSLWSHWGTRTSPSKQSGHCKASWFSEHWHLLCVHLLWLYCPTAPHFIILSPSRTYRFPAEYSSLLWEEAGVSKDREKDLRTQRASSLCSLFCWRMEAVQVTSVLRCRRKARAV